jgi:CBS domain-containing protein
MKQSMAGTAPIRGSKLELRPGALRARAARTFDREALGFTQEGTMRRRLLNGARDGSRARRLAFLGGMGLGSFASYALAYFGDGRLGRRRRALAGAKASHLVHAGTQRFGRTRRGLVNHARGWAARWRARRRKEAVADEVIAQRVRAALGRACSHVGVLEVSVTDGCVALGGPVLESEHRRVIRTACRVNGVRAVDDRLERHRRADITALRDKPARGTRNGGARQRRCVDLMRKTVQTATEDDSLRYAAETMAAANVGFLPVCSDEGRVIGTVTDRDIVVRAVALGLDPDTARVADVMSHNVVACRPDDDLSLAEQFMAHYQVSRLAITDEDDVIVGVISLSDIAEHEPARRSARTLRSIAAREAPRPS